MKGTAFLAVLSLGVFGAGVVETEGQLIPELLNTITRPFGMVMNGINNLARDGFNWVNWTVANVTRSAGTVTERIRRLLEVFRKRMNIGIPELGLPILDPLKIERFDIDFEQESLTLKGYLEHMEIRNLSRFMLDHVQYDLRNVLELNLTFPELDITGDYDLKGKLSQFALFGKGPFQLKLFDLSVATISQLRVVPRLPGVEVQSLELWVKLGRIENNFENLMNNSKIGEVVNRAITQLTPEALDTLWDKIEPAISDMVVEIINNTLQDFQLSNLVGRFFNLFKVNLNQRRLSLKT